MQKLALITGATSGIGLCTAKKLAQEKFHLILTGRRMEKLEALKNELQSITQVNIFSFDISKESEVLAFYQTHKTLLEKVTAIINNAGLALGTEKFQSANLKDMDTMFDTNIKGLVHITRHILPHMIKNNFGDIVNLGSVAGRWTYSGGAAYCATKFAVRAISESLRMDLLGTKIRVTNIEPGMVETEFSEVRFAGDKQKASKVYEGMTPLSPQDIADTIAWVLNRPEHINIQELVIFPTDQAAVGQVHRRL